MKKQKRNTLILMVLLLLITLTAAYVASTYAKYTAEITDKDGTATVATWAFDTENDKTLTVALDETYDATTLVADRIAPGTKGSFAIQLTNANSETGVDFTLNVGTPTGVPTNLKFYKDANRTSELSASNAVTGQIKAKDGTGIAATIYWEWKYETGTSASEITAGDSADTTNGKAQSKSVTVPITIKGVQTRPDDTAITTHLD